MRRGAWSVTCAGLVSVGEGGKPEPDENCWPHFEVRARGRSPRSAAQLGFDIEEEHWATRPLWATTLLAMDSCIIDTANAPTDNRFRQKSACTVAMLGKDVTIVACAWNWIRRWDGNQCLVEPHAEMRTRSSRACCTRSKNVTRAIALLIQSQDRRNDRLFSDLLVVGSARASTSWRPRLVTNREQTPD